MESEGVREGEREKKQGTFSVIMERISGFHSFLIKLSGQQKLVSQGRKVKKESSFSEK